MNIKRIGLKENATEDMVGIAAFDNRWLFGGKISSTETIPYEVVYYKPDQKTSIHYTEDSFIDTSYIVAKGEEADLVISEAKNDLDCYTWQEILDEYATTSDLNRRIKLIHIAGITAPYLELDSEYKKFFDDCLQDEDPQIRIAVILMMGYMAWPFWKEVLNELQSNDPNAEVRQSVEKMLESFERVEREQLEAAEQSNNTNYEEEETEETKSIEDLNLDVSVIVSKYLFTDSASVECEIEDDLIKEIYILIGKDVTASLLESHLKYLDLIKQYIKPMERLKSLRTSFERWSESHTSDKISLSEESYASQIKNTFEYLKKDIILHIEGMSLMETLEENVNKFNHFGGGKGMTIFGRTAKLIQEKVPETIAECMELLCILEDYEDDVDPLDIVAEPDWWDSFQKKEFDAFYHTLKYWDNEMDKLEIAIKEIESDPEEGYSQKTYF